MRLKRVAEELGCSMLEAANADPSWRQAADFVLRARAESATHRGAEAS